jgi:hypothetical protein
MHRYLRREDLLISKVLNRSIRERICLTKPWFLRADLKVGILLLLLKSVIQNTIYYCKTMLTLQATLNGFSFERRIPKVITKFDLTC